MTKLKMPTLSTRGWLNTPELIIDEVLSNYLDANPSQTLLFNGNVVSLQYAIYKTNNDGRELSTRVKSDLEKVYGEYSKNITLDITYTETDGKINLKIAGTIEIEGRNFDLNRVVSDTKSKFSDTHTPTKV